MKLNNTAVAGRIIGGLLSLTIIACQKDTKASLDERSLKQASLVSQYAPKPEDFNSQYEFVEALRVFIHTSSIDTSPRPEHYGYLQADIYLSDILSYLQGTSPKPHLSCGDRAVAFKYMLLHFNIPARAVNLLTSDYDVIQGHILTEWHDGNLWVLEDADYNLRYLKSDLSPASLKDIIISQNVEADFIPYQNNSYSWDVTSEVGSPRNLLNTNYFAAGAIIDTNQGFLNSQRFDQNKIFKDINSTIFNYGFNLEVF